jgi:hypothetical protein
LIKKKSKQQDYEQQKVPFFSGEDGRVDVVFVEVVVVVGVVVVGVVVVVVGVVGVEVGSLSLSFTMTADWTLFEDCNLSGVPTDGRRVEDAPADGRRSKGFSSATQHKQHKTHHSLMIEIILFYVLVAPLPLGEVVATLAEAFNHGACGC